MKFCRFDEGRLGLVEGNTVRDVTVALDVLPSHSYPFPQHDLFIAHLDAVAARARELARDAPVLPLDRVTLLSPVANPGKIIAAPVNYQKHLDEVRDNPQLHGNNPAEHVHDSQRRSLPEGDELARRAGAGHRCPMREAAHRS